jgi:hypothetical protein
MMWTGHVTGIREMRNAYKILVGKPKRKRLLEISRCRWAGNTKTDIKEMGWEGVD